MMLVTIRWPASEDALFAEGALDDRLDEPFSVVAEDGVHTGVIRRFQVVDDGQAILMTLEMEG